MDSTKKYRIDQWVEGALYQLLEKMMAKGQITEADAVMLTPLAFHLLHKIGYTSRR